MDKGKKLYEALPRELHASSPLSLLLAPRLPMSFSEYPAALLLAMELPSDMQKAYYQYKRGRRVT